MNHQSKTINSGPIGASKASTLDKYFNDLYSHDKRIFQTLPDDILDTMQCCTGNVTWIGCKFSFELIFKVDGPVHKSRMKKPSNLLMMTVYFHRPSKISSVANLFPN